MFKNYITTAFRNLTRNKVFSIINIGGLAIGLAVAMLILVFVRHELQYDGWVTNGDRVVRMESIWPIAGREEIVFSKAPPPSSVALKEYFPNEIEVTARLRYMDVNVAHKDRLFAEKVNFVSSDFFKIFDLKMISGSRDALHSNNRNLIISENMAQKYFGEISPLGEILSFNGVDDYVVVGIFQNISDRSHLDLGFITALDTGPFPWMDTAWDYVDTFYHYVKFRPGYGPADIDQRMVGFVANKAISSSPDPDYRTENGLVLDFIPLKDIHLHANKSQPIKSGGSFALVVSFIVVAMLILLIGSINFMNLSTARAMRRAREVSMRKVVGASRRQLISQFLGEAITIAMLAFFLAVLLAELALPFYNEFLGKDLSLNLTTDPLQTIGFFILAAAVGLFGGIYPAFFMSNMNPSKELKANMSSQAGGAYLRQMLVVFQFSVLIGLMSTTAIVFSQTEYARTMDLGFVKENKFSIRDINIEQVRNSAETLRLEIMRVPGVVNVTWASDSIPKKHNNNVNITMLIDGNEQKAMLERIYVDYNFFNLFEIAPLAGRVYSKEFTSDALFVPEDATVPVSRNAVVNESFLKLLGYSLPEEAIGKEFVAPGWYDGQRSLVARIVGIVPDFQMRSARDDYTPMIYFSSTSVLEVMTISIQSNDLSNTLAKIEQIWRYIVPDVPMNGSFIEDDFNAFYKADEHNGKMFALFAIFALAVACSGLFALAAFAIEQRTKEIGLRKVLGATIADILMLLSLQYLKPVLIANFLAWPLSWYFMDDWLKGYIHRIELGVSPFILAGLLAFLIAWLTVGTHAFKAARTNPIHALKCE